MSITDYMIWSPGARVSGGVTGARILGISSVAKPESDQYPHLIINELICNFFARAIMLPVPPGFVVAHHQDRYFACLQFGLAGEDLPPVIPTDVVRTNPWLSAGIILFDSWIMNRDRHNRNLALNTTNGKLQIFDHSHALLADTTDISSWLDQNKDQICIENHCLVGAIDTPEHFSDWAQRIDSVPDFYIRETVLAAAGTTLGNSEANLIANHLVERKSKMLGFIANNQTLFTKISDDSWLRENSDHAESNDSAADPEEVS